MTGTGETGGEARCCCCPHCSGVIVVHVQRGYRAVSPEAFIAAATRLGTAVQGYEVGGDEELMAAIREWRRVVLGVES